MCRVADVPRVVTRVKYPQKVVSGCSTGKKMGDDWDSLPCLKRMIPDRSFVEELKKDAEDTILVSGIVRLAHTLGMQVVAEGVESAEQLKRLQGLGCDLAQGFYFSEALPAEAVPGTLVGVQQKESSGTIPYHGFLSLHLPNLPRLIGLEYRYATGTIIQ